jgi:outer membrane autotransporter protein
MALGFWNAHVEAQQVNANLNLDVNVTLLDQYLIDACIRLRLAGGGQSSSASSGGLGSSGPILTSVPVPTRSTTLAVVNPAALTIAQSDLLTRCTNIQAAASDGDSNALSQVNPSDFNAIKLNALLFADANEAALARMRDLRQAHSGATVGSLDLRYNDLPLFAADSQHRGSGASADNMVDASPWGVWGRINHASGDKDSTDLSGPLDVRHTEYTLGMDYRTANSLLGASIALRNANIDFGAHGDRGGVDNRITTVSAYASSYLLSDLYVDGIVNYGFASYDSTRRITYDEFGTPIDRTALGSADGRTLSIGGSLGYDLAKGPFTITPSLAYFYINAKVDPFAEQGADGLNLAFSEQRYRSSSARLQLNGAYAISARGAVVSPYGRVALIKEFKDDVDAFGARFVDDPDATAGVPVTVEALDDTYCRLALGLSAQFHNDLSAYFDYQVVSGFQSVSLWSATLGLRQQF